MMKRTIFMFLNVLSSNLTLNFYEVSQFKKTKISIQISKEKCYFEFKKKM